MFAQIQLYLYIAIGVAFAGVAGFGYWQYHENLAKTAEISQQAQALAVQKLTIDDLTRQAAEIARKHEELNNKYRAAEDQLQHNLSLPDVEDGQDDTAIDNVGRQIERGTR